MKINNYELKENLYYWSKGGTWLEILPDSRVKVGISDAQLAELLKGRKPTAIVVSPKGSSVKQGGRIAMLRIGKVSLTIESPISGVVDEVNKELTVDKLLKNPYENWLAIIKPSSLDAELSNLVKGDTDEAKEWFRNKVGKLK